MFIYISIIFFVFYFDFFLTGFNPSLYYRWPNFIYWKFGNLIGLSGLAYMYLALERRFFTFKGKTGLIYILVGAILLQFIYPIRIKEDYELASALYMIPIFIGVIILAVFIYAGINIPSFRKNTLLLGTGIILYMIGGFIVSEEFLGPTRDIFGDIIQIPIFLIHMILKSIGLGFSCYSLAKLSFSPQ